MVDLAGQYPNYGFEKHKGYAAKEHIDAVKEFGPCPIHRKKFIRNIMHPQAKQLSLI